MPRFLAFWDSVTPQAGADTARLVGLFRERVVQPYGKFFSRAAGGHSPTDENILTFLRRVPRDIAAMRAISTRLDADLARYMRVFADSLPDFDYHGDVYFYPSLYVRDGGVMRSLPFTPVTLMFGVDVIAHLHGPDADIGAIVHHELFHLYQQEQRHWWQRPKALYELVWNEGVASYAACRLDPRRSDLDILLGDTALARADRRLLRVLASATLARLDDDSGAGDILQAGRSLPGLPPRSGYLIGLRVAEVVGRGRSLQQLARLRGDKLRREMESTLRAIVADTGGRNDPFTTRTCGAT